ncbi:hypothetical protein [Amnibacterium endophyticum]|uniref:Histidine kinase n=1 Tax=Amnibacterium endophyticum TaxID=2109337 RepID=A0ABW4L9E5_9MICO
MSASNTGRRPAGLIALAVIVAVEALATAVIGLLALVASPYGVRSTTGGGTGDPTSGIAVAVFVLIFAVLLAVVAIGLVRTRAWTRSAALVWQIVQALIGAYSLQGAGAAIGFGVAAVALALVALVLLFSRPVREALDRG